MLLVLCRKMIENIYLIRSCLINQKECRKVSHETNSYYAVVQNFSIAGEGLQYKLRVCCFNWNLLPLFYQSLHARIVEVLSTVPVWLVGLSSVFPSVQSVRLSPRTGRTTSLRPLDGTDTHWQSVLIYARDGRPAL